ncbi:hypothetical protein D3C79_660110 [compost metagenome]
MGQRDRRRKLRILWRAHIRLDELEQIRRRGLDAVRLGGQHAGVDPDGLVRLVIAKGVVAHGCLGHLDIGMLQLELGQHSLLHHLLEGLPPAARRQMAEQANARIRILAMSTGRIGG